MSKNQERQSAATSRENEKPTAVGGQTGGELAAAPCSAQGGVSDKQDGKGSRNTEDWSCAISYGDQKAEILIHENGNPDNCISMPITLERLKNVRDGCNRIITKWEYACAEQI